MTSWNQIGDPAKRTIRAITPVTGETTNDYVEIIDLDTRWLTDTVLTITNTLAVNELTYRVLVYSDYANGKEYEITSNTVAVSDSDQVILRRHARVKVYVKATSLGNQTDYQIDCIAGRG
jgi:hypothetical protein